MIFVNGTKLEQNHFPDGTLFIRPTNHNIEVRIDWEYESDAELFTIICLRRHFADHEAILYMPYLPHARMDRVKAEDDVFTLKYFCEIINSLNFKEVIVKDVHSNVSLALLNRVTNRFPKTDIGMVLSDMKSHKKNIALFFPDEGAMKRYAEHFSQYDFAFGMKKRDWRSGKILGLDILQKENIVGKDVLIIDDICSKGGTFYHSAKALLEAGAASVSLYITHCENSILQGELFTCGMINKFYTTRSIPHVAEVAEHFCYV